MNSERGRFALGLIVGLLLGLALALGVALYVTKVPIPFVNKVPQRTAEQDAAEAERNRHWDPNAALPGRSSARPASAAAGGVVVAEPAASATPAPAASSPALTGGEKAAARDPAAILSGQPAASASARSTAGGADPFTYFVQAGAYSRPEDAEQQRARLAMLGVQARVTEREQSGRTVYRVRVGPFDSRDDAESTISRLQGSSVDSALVRVER